VFVLVGASDGGLHLQLTLPGDRGAWTRTLPATDEPDARFESIGVVMRAMATSIEARPAASSPTHAPAPSPVAPTPAEVMPTASPRHAASVDLGLGYTGTHVSDDAPWHSAVALRAHVLARPRLATLLGVAWSPGQDAADPLTLSRVTFDAGVAAMLRPRARARPLLGGGVTAEALGWTVIGGEAGWGARVAVHVLAGVDAALSPRVGLVALARLDAWCRNARIVIDTPEGRRLITRGHPAAAAAFVGLRLRLGGRFLHPSRAGDRHGGR
jgi:hypothetical protein